MLQSKQVLLQDINPVEHVFSHSNNLPQILILAQLAQLELNPFTLCIDIITNTGIGNGGSIHIISDVITGFVKQAISIHLIHYLVIKSFYMIMRHSYTCKLKICDAPCVYVLLKLYNLLPWFYWYSCIRIYTCYGYTKYCVTYPNCTTSYQLSNINDIYSHIRTTT